MHDPNLKPNDNYKKIFKAQLIKDIAMSHKVCELFETHETDDEKFLVIAGKGHMQHFNGVPERVYERFPALKDDSMLIVTHESDHCIDINESEANFLEGVEDVFGKEGSDPADVLFFFEGEEQVKQ